MMLIAAVGKKQLNATENLYRHSTLKIMTSYCLSGFSFCSYNARITTLAAIQPKMAGM